MKTNHIPTAATLAAALAAGLTLAACQPAQDNAAAPGRAEAGATALADKAADTVADAAITVAVNAALAKDAQLSVLRIDVDTVDGRVVLAGKAPDDAARQRAGELAQRVHGVKSVDNRLAVAPLS